MIALEKVLFFFEYKILFYKLESVYLCKNNVTILTFISAYFVKIKNKKIKK
jgi:hypothetical protein